MEITAIYMLRLKNIYKENVSDAKYSEDFIDKIKLCNN